MAGSDSSACTPSARSRNPSMSPVRERKNSDRSATRSTPVRRERIANTALVPRPDHASGEPGGGEQHAQRAALEELRQPARRVEEVQRVARGRGVEHDRVEVALAVELVELGDRGELLRSGDRRGQLAVDAVGEHLLGRLGVGGEAHDQLVEGALGVEHHRPQLALRLDAAGRASSAGRRAGARCRAAAGRARWPGAARGRSSRRPPSGRGARGRGRARPRSSSCRPRRSRRRCTCACPAGARSSVTGAAPAGAARCSISGAPSASTNSCGRVTGDGGHVAAKARDLALLGDRRAGARGGRRAARPYAPSPRRASSAAASSASSAALKRRGCTPLTITRSSLRPSPSASASPQLERLGHRGLARLGHGDDRAARPDRRSSRRSSGPAGRSGRRWPRRRTCAAPAASRRRGRWRGRRR